MCYTKRLSKRSEPVRTVSPHPDVRGWKYARNDDYIKYHIISFKNYKNYKKHKKLTVSLKESVNSLTKILQRG